MSKQRYLRGKFRTSLVAAVAAVLAAVLAAAVPASAKITTAQPTTPMKITTAQPTTPMKITTAQPTAPIKHVVVVYLENHSFDSLLGYWCDQPAQVAVHRCPGGGMPATVTLSDGTVVTPSTDPDRVPNINHDGPSQVAAMNGGLMNGWQNIVPNGQLGGCSAAYAYQCISGYRPSQIPNITSLATQFAISDRFFSMSDSPSWEGHLYAVAASTDGFWGNNPWCGQGGKCGAGWGCDSGKVTLWQASPTAQLQTVPSCVPDPSRGRPNGGAWEPTPAQYAPTIMDRLGAAGLPWKIYGATDSKGNTQGYGAWDICPSFAECLDTPQRHSLVPDAQFYTDAAAGTLPAFSVVTPGGPYFSDSCHNGESMTACDNWLGSLITAAENSPEWGSTAVFVTWDDFGGFYDQVYPGTSSNPDATQEGPRLPLIAVSPYARPGYTDTTAATFASILRFTEETFGLAPLGPNDAQAYDLSGMFDYSQTPVKPARMVQRPTPAWARKPLPAWMVNDPS